jgi:tetratricopeptide (TPR) repeat protein
LEKRAIQDASIAGRVFWLGAVTSAGLPAAEAAAALERLQERELVEARVASAVAGDQEFVFTHALIPEVAYSTLPKAARSLKHVRFAEWFERVAQRGDEFLEVLAHHYEQAWRYRFETGDPGEDLARKAIHAIRHAGSRAKDLRTLPEARRLYERALEIFRSARMENDRALLLELLTERSEVVKWLSSPDVVLADTRAVIDGAPAIGRRDLLARAWLNRAFAEYARGRLRPADDALHRAEELFRTLQDRQGEAEALEMVGNITEDLRGQLRAARDAYGQALALYRAMGNAQGMARTMDRAGWCLLNAGRLDEAEVTLGDALRLAQDSHERISEADAVKGLAVVAHLKGDVQKAVDGYQAAIRTCLEMGDLMGAAHAHRHLGMHYLRVGRVEDAEGELGTAQALRVQHGAKGESAGILRGLADVHLATGDLLRAADYAERACAAVPPYDELARATYGATLGRVRASQGRAAEADALFQESLRGLERKEYVIDLALALLKHGDALLTLKRPESAGPVLDRARTLFAQMGATFFVRELDARVHAAMPREIRPA